MASFFLIVIVQNFFNFCEELNCTEICFSKIDLTFFYAEDFSYLPWTSFPSKIFIKFKKNTALNLFCDISTVAN